MRHASLVPLAVCVLGATALLTLALRGEHARADDPALSSAPSAQRPFPTLSVSATVDVRIAPDEAWLHLGVESFKPTVREAVADADERMTAALASLRKGGVAADDIGTEYIMLTASTEYDKTRGAETHGFRASRRFAVHVRAIDNVETLLKGALEAGVTNVYDVNFASTRSVEMKDEARTHAVADAKKKAEGMAAAIGQRVGRAVTLTDGWGGGVQTGFNNANYANEFLNSGGQGFQGAAVAAGRIQVSLTVTATFELL